MLLGNLAQFSQTQWHNYTQNGSVDGKRLDESNSFVHILDLVAVDLELVQGTLDGRWEYQPYKISSHSQRPGEDSSNF